MELIPNFLRNHEEIVKICLENPDKFIPRREDPMGGHTGLVDATSTFSSWKRDYMEDWFIDLIFSECDIDQDLRDFNHDIQIQRYFPGQFIVPHKDNYDITKLHLITLTTSNVDGIMLINDKDVIRVPDLAGQKIEYDFNEPHWVDPVFDLRFSLVILE